MESLLIQVLHSTHLFDDRPSEIQVWISYLPDDKEVLDFFDVCVTEGISKIYRWLDLSSNVVNKVHQMAEEEVLSFF